MGEDGLRVSGGTAGISARLTDLRSYADRSDTSGDVVRRVAGALSGLVGDGDLVASAVLSPSTAASAEVALVDVSARVAASAVRLETTAAGLRMVATAWEAADAAAAIRQDVGEVATFGVVGLGGLALTVLSAPAVYAGNATERVGEALAAGWQDGWGALADGLSTAAQDAGEDTLGDVGGAWSNLLLGMPEVTDAAVEGLGAVASAAVGTPLAYEDTVIGLLTVLGLAGAFDDSPGITVERADLDDLPLDQRAEVAVPTSIEDLFRGQGLLMQATADDPGGSRVRVFEVSHEGGSAWVVQIPGTQEWGLTAGADPSDLTSNLHLTGHEDAALLDAVTEALAMAGAGPDDPVMTVGHSQGGIAAAALAAREDSGLNITHVVTGGSPIAHVDVPDDVQVLSLEHAEDPVPRLDGDANPDRPNWTTAVRDVDDAPTVTDPMAAHSSDLYAGTGAAVDASDDPSVQAFLDGAQVFLGPAAGADTTILDFTIVREGS